ncbi:SpaA isopeptide-forming pilin-related protein [Enterococcus asini]|uniref:SpaA isopeptide-forming pilin-related protein n=1 Tax=Enterococcus asini TaxID=57732 RepID=UPI0022E6A2A2|nr:SpaA isopeptide-forming pilin-related protein [Enterococcus asini]
MVKRHKRSLTLAALVLLLAQVFLMTFCNITAIAVTKEESSGSLFDNEFGNASVSYEETSTERLKWTVHLTKATQETATRFMLEVTGDGQAVTPENVQVLTKSNPTMSFAAGNGAGQITAGMSETAATTTGSAVITFDTNRSYTAMTVKPKLIADVNPATDLLAGNTGKSFTIPQVATSESTSENNAVAASEAPVSESSVTEATSSTEAAATEETTATSEATESTEQSATTDSTTASTEATEESDVEDESDVKANADTGIVPAESHYTGLRFEKTWVFPDGVPSPLPDEAQTVQVQIKRRIVGSTTWDKYQEPKDINYSDATIIDGKIVTVDEWHNLPLYDADGKQYEYTLEELPNAYYDSEQGKTVESTISNVTEVPNNNESKWSYTDTGFIIASIKGKWFIWTVDPVLDKEAFMNNVKGYTGKPGGSGNSFDKFKTDATLSNTVWVTGNTDGIIDGVDYGITTEVEYKDTGEFVASIIFGATKLWTQFFYGGHTTAMVPITNTYNPPTKITVQKNWNDESNAYNTREDIQLVVKRQLAGETGWTVVDDEANPFKIDNEEAGNTFSHEFTLPSKVDGKTATYKVVEMVWNDSTQEYEERAVKGYDDPKYSNEDGLTSGTLSVDNDLKTYNISVQKIWDDKENAYNTRKDIQLVLQRQLEGETTWSDVGTHDIAHDATSEADLSKLFEDVPSVVNGLNATYRVVERVTVDGKTQERVPGYEMPVYNHESISESGNLTVTNKLLTTELEFTKVGNDGSTPLSGVSFTVTGKNGYEKTLSTGDDGKVSFKDLLELNPDKDDYYTLTETGLPGYLSAGPWEFGFVYNERSNSLKIVWKDGSAPLKDGKLVNKLKPFDLTVNKKDDLGNVLKGAEFTLTGPEGFETQVLPNAENPGPISEFTFTGLSPGTYTLTETKVPDGYAKLSEAITITINEDGKVKVTGANATSDLTVEGNNTISFDVKNKKKVPLPSTGGPGTLFFSLIGMLALGATGLYFYFRKDQEVA